LKVFIFFIPVEKFEEIMDPILAASAKGYGAVGKYRGARIFFDDVAGRPVVVDHLLLLHHYYHATSRVRSQAAGERRRHLNNTLLV